MEAPDGRPRPAVRRGWEPPPAPWAAGHRGVDLAAAPGEPVRAVAAGTVSFAGKVAGTEVVSIELNATGKPPLRTAYQPVHPTVHKGDHVTAGQQVGTLAPDSESKPDTPDQRKDRPHQRKAVRRHCPAACLHWGLLRGRRYLDPLTLLPPGLLGYGPSRLLPVHGIPLPREGGPAHHTLIGAPRTAGDRQTSHTVMTTALLICAAGWAHRRLRRSTRSRDNTGRHRTGVARLRAAITLIRKA
ncbi:M23 family metallopeptidase [Streptomyces cacaoi]|nr:M23 family metallopeptidase [Streptomyces cacaoi]